MLMNLFQWKLHNSPNRLLQYRLGIQLDLYIFCALPPIQHFFNDICPSVRLNELLRPSSFPHQSPLLYFWLSSDPTPESFPIYQFLVHCFQNKFLNQIAMLLWIVPSPTIWSSWWFGTEFLKRSLVDSSASKIHASFVLILLVASLPQFFIILQDIAGVTDVSNFLRAFLMVSLNSVSSASMEYIPRNFRAISSWSFSSDHFCFSFSLTCFSIDFQSSGHRWSGLDVSCFLVNLTQDTFFRLENFFL